MTKKKIAYKTAKNLGDVPDGFIIDHFETTDNQVEGYTVVNQEVFSQLLANNVALIRSKENSKIDKTAPPPQSIAQNNASSIKPHTHAEPVDHQLMAQKIKEMEDRRKATEEELALFQKFLEWKRSQESGS